MKNPAGTPHPGVVQYLICYLVFIVIALATVWLSLQVRTNLISMPLAFSGMDSRMVRLLDYVSLILMGLFVLILIVIFEHVLRTSMLRNRFWSRVLRIVVIEAIIVAFSYGANFVIMKLLIRA